MNGFSSGKHVKIIRQVSFDSLAVITQIGELGPMQELMHCGVSSNGISILIYDRLFECFQ